MGRPLSALRHERHYTVTQANAQRDWVADRVAAVRAAIDALADDDAQQALEAIDADSGGGYPGYEVAAAVLGLLGSLSELESKDIMLRDPDRGLVDFPSIRDGREIYLCWLVDENEVGWWHEPEAGFTGRQPL